MRDCKSRVKGSRMPARNIVSWVLTWTGVRWEKADCSITVISQIVGKTCVLAGFYNLR